MSQSTTSAAALEGEQASASQEGLEGVPVAPSASTDASQTSRIAETKDVNTAEYDNDPPASKPKYHVQSFYGTYEVYGVDTIWHNIYSGPDSDLTTMRKQYHCDINLMILKVAEHVRDGVYTVVSMNATPHMLVVVCILEKLMADLPENMWDDPSDLE